MWSPLLAPVARRGDDDGTLLQRVLDGGVLAALGMRGCAVVAQGEVDDVGAVVGGPADAVGQGRTAGLAGLVAGRVGGFEDHPDREDLRLGGDAEHSVGAADAVAAAGDDSGHRGAVAGPGAVASPGTEADQVLAVQYLARQVGKAVVDPGVDDGDGDPLALGRLPRPVGVERLQPHCCGRMVSARAGTAGSSVNTVAAQSAPRARRWRRLFIAAAPRGR